MKHTFYYVGRTSFKLISYERSIGKQKVRDKEARRFQKTRKTIAKMGGLCKEIK